jgi:hypothetical protein
MNKIKTIGLSALAGSMALTSANAVDYTISGDAAWSYANETYDGGANAAGGGDGFSLDTTIYFDASGSLDNGWDVSFGLDFDNADGAVSNTSSQAAITMGSMGTIQLNNIGGSATNAIDDVTPSAWEEVYGMGTISTGTQSNPQSVEVGGDAGFFGSSTSTGSIQYTAPALETAGATITASIVYDPNANASAKTAHQGGNVGETGMGYVLKVAHESGLEVGAGLETIESDKNYGATAGRESKDEESVTAYVKYSMGPITAAYQESYQDTLDGGKDFEAEMYSVAYTAGDVSVSWGETEVTTKGLAADGHETTSGDAIAVSYTMGSMTIQAQRSEQSRSTVATTGGTAATRDLDETGIKVSFAF